MKRYIKNGEIKFANEIQVFITESNVRSQIINPKEKDILADGWSEYIPTKAKHHVKLYPIESEVLLSVIYRLARKHASEIIAEVKNLPDKEALEVKALFEPWAKYIGERVTAGQRLYYDGRLYKVRQGHTVQKQFPPSDATASLYEETCEEHVGTEQDPIPYNGNMRLELGKVYSQYGKKYRCFRDTGVAVYNDLDDLNEIYVNLI